MNFSEMPVEIWADLLEEQGEDTTELREWIASGLKIGEFYSSDDYSYYCGYGNGYDYVYDNGYDYDYGDGYDYGYGDGNGNGYVRGHGHSTE